MQHLLLQNEPLVRYMVSEVHACPTYQFVILVLHVHATCHTSPDVTEHLPLRMLSPIMDVYSDYIHRNEDDCIRSQLRVERKQKW